MRQSKKKRKTRISKKVRQAIMRAQRNEITEYYIYQRLADLSKGKHNKKVLKHIANDELGHYQQWKNLSEKEVPPNRWQIFKYLLYSRLLGLTFGVKLMEKGEEKAQLAYQGLTKSVPLARKIRQDENRHEKELLGMINEERIKYIGSVVLGLSDALVELTGTLAGLTFALQNSRLIATAGLITGIAASFSMAASEYLSTKSEQTNKDPLKASIYTGIAYVLTVIFLISPYLLVSSYFWALVITMVIAIVIILAFTFYISVARDLSFKRRFAEMALISLGVAALSFGIGYLVRIFLGVEV